jgi:hypothetical protein
MSSASSICGAAATPWRRLRRSRAEPVDLAALLIALVVARALARPCPRVSSSTPEPSPRAGTRAWPRWYGGLGAPTWLGPGHSRSAWRQCSASVQSSAGSHHQLRLSARRPGHRSAGTRLKETRATSPLWGRDSHGRRSSAMPASAAEPTRQAPAPAASARQGACGAPGARSALDPVSLRVLLQPGTSPQALQRPLACLESRLPADRP